MELMSYSLSLDVCDPIMVLNLFFIFRHGLTRIDTDCEEIGLHFRYDPELLRDDRHSDRSALIRVNPCLK